MHAKKTWAVAAALALASTAVADQGRPRIYFPRNIKRQIVNPNVNTTQAETTSTSASVTPEPSTSSTDDESTPAYSPPSTDDEPSSDTSPPSTDSESASDTSRPTDADADDDDDDDDDSPVGGLLPTPDESSSDASKPTDDDDSPLDGLLPTPDESTSDTSKPTDDDDSPLDGLLPTPDKSTSEPRSDSSTSESPSRGFPDIEDILTLSLPSTVDVTSTASESSASKTSTGFPDIFVRPTLTESEEEEESSSTEEQTTPTTSDGGLLVAPTGLLSGGLGLTGLPDLGLGGKKSSETIGTDSTGSANPTAPTGTESESETASESESTKDGVWPEPTWLHPTAPSDSDSYTIPSVTDSKPSGTGILDPILDPINSAVDDLSIPPPVNFSDPTAPAGTGTEPALTLLPTIPSVTEPNLPGLTGLPIPDLGNGSDPNTNPLTNPGFTNPAGVDPTAPPLSGGLTGLPTGLPVDPTNLTIPVPDPTSAPTGTAVIPPPVNTTTPTDLLPGVTDTTSSEEPIKTIVPIENSTIPEPHPTTKPPPIVHVTTIKPIATVSKDNWLGTQLIADEATATETANTDAPAPTQSETLPAGMPNSIDASSDDVEQPDGTTLIRVVFDRRLHYEFVADNFTATQQIFMYLPMVIGHGEGIEKEQTKMLRLEPIETKQKKGWITTAAFAYVPDDIIDRLQMDIHLTNSELYNPPHSIARGIASAIDPSYGIFPGSDLEVSKDDSKEGPGGAPFGGGDDSGEEQSATQKGTTAGIAVGAVGAAVAYGAAMFLVARRYKRKKQSHRRSSSISGAAPPGGIGGAPGGPSHSPTSDMRFTESGSPATAMMGGALLSRDFSGAGAGYGGVAGGSAGTAGGRTSQGSGQSGAGNSGRTAGFISAPVAAENSLGWN